MRPADTALAATSSAIGIGTGAKPGAGDVGIGYQALAATTTDNLKNVAIGYQALTANTTGNASVAVGYGTLKAQTVGGGNVAIGGPDNYGASPLQALTTHTSNVAIWAPRLVSAGNPNDSIGINLWADKNGTGIDSINIGGYSGSTSVGQADVAIGVHTLTSSGGYNTAIGGAAGEAMTSGAANTLIGVGVGANTLATGSANVLIGADGTGSVDTALSGTSSAIGIGAGTKPGSGDTALGYYALHSTTTDGSQNIAIGLSGALFQHSRLRQYRYRRKQFWQCAWFECGWCLQYRHRQWRTCKFSQ